MATDAESRQIIYQGATIAQLAAMFEKRGGDVLRRLSSVTPVGKRDGKDIYRIKDVAGHLGDIPENVVSRVMRMNHADLPPMLRKEYWIGLKMKAQYEEMQGDLWSTAAVIEYVAASFKDIRMALLLMSDSIERDTTLTEPQREAIKRMTDSVLEDIRARLAKTFFEKRDDEAGRPGGVAKLPEPDERSAFDIAEEAGL